MVPRKIALLALLDSLLVVEVCLGQKRVDIEPIDETYYYPNRFRGKTMLITGAARGIGAAVATRAAKEGANVVIADWLEKEGMETAELINSLGEGAGKAAFVLTDVSNSLNARRMVNETVAHFGRLDYAVNNAGITDGAFSGDRFDHETQEPLLPNNLHAATDVYWTNVMAVNAGGVFNSLRAELGQMIEQGTGGAIVNVGSVAGLIGLPGNPAYSASKFAVEGLTRNAAIDYAPFGIRVNSVNMAQTDTPMIERAAIIVDYLQKQGGNGMGSLKTQSILQKADSGHRASTVWEQAAVILFLLSDEASNLTGATFATDGGWTAY